MAFSAAITEPLLDTWMEPPNLRPAVCGQGWLYSRQCEHCEGRQGATEREEEDGGEEQEHGTGHAQAQDDGGHDGGAVARRMWKFNTIRPIRYNM